MIWIIIILFVLLLVAIDPRSWGQWAREGWTDLMVRSITRDPSDIEIRADYRKRDMQDVPFVKPEDIINYPDPILDRLIYEERFDEANRYRMKHLMEARENRNREALQTYIIYKRMISTARARADERSRRELRQKYPRIQERRTEIVTEPVDRTGLPQTAFTRAVTMLRSRFLEIEDNSPAARPPLPEPAGKSEPNSDRSDTPLDTNDEDGYEDLISV